MSDAYLVTDGSYSDYHVVAAFSDEKVAEAYRDAGKYDSVEAYTLDTHKEDWYRTYAYIDRQGVVHRTETVFARHTQEAPRIYDGLLKTSVHGMDVERAIKHANEVRTMWVAENRPWEAPKVFDINNALTGLSVGCLTEK